jgi:Tol biopolymer transport system component
MMLQGDLTSAFPVHVTGGTLFYGVAVEAVRVHSATIDWETSRISAPVPVASTISGMSVYPAWSPDGRTLAYIHQPLASRSRSLMLRSAQGDEVRELTQLDMANPGGLAWSPNGTTILLHGNGKTAATALYRADVRTGEISMLLEGIGKGFAVGPDESIYLFRNAAPGVEPGIYEYDPGNGDLRKIADDAHISAQYNIGTSPDGSKLAYSRFDRDQMLHELLVVPTKGGEAQVILSTPAPGSITPSANTMVWSPDGQWIVFRRRASGDASASSTLEMISVDGGEPKVLIEGDAPQHVELHPDGRHLAFVTGSEKKELWTMSLDGSRE